MSRVLKDDVGTIWDAVLHIESTHSKCKPVLRTSVSLIHVEPVIDIEEYRRKPNQDKKHVGDQPCEFVSSIPVRFELYFIDDHVIDLENSPHIDIEEQFQENKRRCFCNSIDKEQKDAENIQKTFDAEIIFHDLPSIGNKVA